MLVGEQNHSYLAQTETKHFMNEIVVLHENCTSIWLDWHLKR